MADFPDQDKALPPTRPERRARSAAPEPTSDAATSAENSPALPVRDRRAPLTFWQELRRRKVVRLGSIYLVSAWVIAQVCNTVLPVFAAPSWLMPAILILLALGFPPALILAWAFDITALGIVRTSGSLPPPTTSRLIPRKLLIGVGFVLAFAALIFFYRVDIVRIAQHASANAASASAKPAVRPNSIAVLPFVNLSKDAENEYFSDGLSEQMLNALAQIPELHVAGRTSGFSFKGKNEDLRAIGEKLGVATILQGSVAKSGNRLRITAQLAKAEDGFQMWSQTFDRELNDVFALQDEITAQVVGALRLKLLSGKMPGVIRSSNIEAYNQYLLGHNFHKQGTKQGWDLAVRAFERAIALDGQFAAPHAELAEVLDILADYADTSMVMAEFKTKALAHANHAIKLAPEAAGGYTARARVRVGALDFSGAAEDVEKAMNLSPGDARNLQRYAQSLMRLGRVDEALAAATKAVELDPLADNALLFTGIINIAQGGYPAAQAELNRALQISPDHLYTRTQLGITFLLQGDLNQAQTIFEHQTDEFWRGYGMALVHYKQGNVVAMNNELAILIQNDKHTMAYQIAEVFAWSGRPDQAFDWLQRAYQQKDGGLEFIKTAPLLRTLHDDRRFAALVRQLKLPES